MHRIVAGATGLIGTSLVNHWLSESCKVTVIGRSRDKIVAKFGNRVRAVLWDEITQDLFADAEVVVNLAGCGVADKRWSEQRKHDILHSRIDATKRLAMMLALLGRRSPPLFNASAIGVYGLQKQIPSKLPPALDESQPIDFHVAPDFLATVGREWEKATRIASEAGVRVVNLRFGVVLAKQGGALPLMVRPFYFYVGGKVGSGYQPFSWVSLQDVVGAIDFLIDKKEVEGPVNIVAPQCVNQQELACAIGRVLQKPNWTTMPGVVLKTLMGAEMAEELLLEGQHVYPQRLLDLGYHFAYPDIMSALTRNLRR